MILCGWCGQPTEPGRCGNCRRDPAIPWLQRAEEPPLADSGSKRRLTEAAKALGHDASVERIAEYLDVSPRTVRRWREMSA